MTSTNNRSHGFAASARRKGRLAYLAAFGLTAALYAAGSLDFAERQVAELNFRMLDRPATGGVVLVEIDAQSIEKIGVWPWPRRLHADALDRLVAAGARRVAFDVDFSAASSPTDDARFAAALKRAGGRVALPVFTQRASSGAQAAALVDSLPLTMFRADAEPVAMNVYPSPDGLVRTLFADDMLGGRSYVSLAAWLAGPAADTPAFAIDFGIDPATVPRLSFHDVLRGRFDPAVVAGRW